MLIFEGEMVGYVCDICFMEIVIISCDNLEEDDVVVVLFSCL